ncbi:MAG TPA: rod shape-determining protein RodA [Gemmatimonadaceae bacterium]|nr:rod shape-determining protein RodA [Gemmatimonadaceae bacterium]
MRRVVAGYPLVITALLLSLYGVAMVYSAGQTDVPTVAAHAWIAQLRWLAFGLVGAYIVSRGSVRFYEWVALPAYVISCIVLLFTWKFGGGAGDAASSHSWLVIGGHRLGQPTELAKVTTVLMLARELAARREAPRSLLELWRPAVVILIPWLLIMAQPDLGSAMVFIGIFFAMLYWSGVPFPLLVLLASPAVSLILAFSTSLWGAWFIALLLLVLWYKPYMLEGVGLVTANVIMGVLAPITWDRLSEYQKHRLLVFLDPTIDPRRSGWHVIQSQVAIGSGGWLGKGYLAGTQKRLAFLPEQHTDFIFAVVGEELGFIGVTLALALFFYLLLRAVRVASSANDAFSTLAAFGIASCWLVHIIVNVGMTLNLMPITGIPLPFFSYGGSFMVSCWIAVGILVRIASEGRGARIGDVAV